MKKKEWKQRIIPEHTYSGMHHKHIDDILASRGAIESVEKTLKGLKLLPWDGLKDMSLATEILYQYIIDDKKIVILADYDCDGATACSIMYKGLRLLGANHVDFIVPNRFKHGYGLTPALVDAIIEQFDDKPDLIVTVDNGTASLDGVEYANKNGIKVLVTDHHLPAEKKPNALAIVNPNQHGCTFESKAMAGCGVAFYIIQSLAEYKAMKDGTTFKPLVELMDILALGTVADVVPLDLNNRLIVKYGLLRIRNGLLCLGILALFEIAGKDYRDATTSDFGFAIAPRLNAAGRLDDMTIGIKCLLEDSYPKALNYATQLNEMNEVRKKIGRDMEKNANITLENISFYGSQEFIRVVYGKDYHEGVMGIVAGRIKEKENLPTIVFAPTEDDAIIKGSGRSIPNFNLRDAIDEVDRLAPNTIIKFGGHAMAAGLNIKKDKLNDFISAFDKVAKRMLNNIKPSEIILHDGLFPQELFNVDSIKNINSLVWGQKWESPIWVDNFTLEQFKTMGSEKNHGSLLLRFTNGRRHSVKGVWFFLNNEQINFLEKNVGNDILIAYTLSINVFMEKESIQLMIVDAKAKDY